MIVLRFVFVKGPVTDLILFQTGGGFSHVEALTTKNTLIGAHTTGVEERPRSYDANTLTREKFLLLPADDGMSAKFEHYLRACIGEPYDYRAIGGFVHHLDRHQEHRTICSALVTLALRGCAWLPVPLPVLAHMISVRDLELGLAMRPDVREVPPSDADLLAHVAGAADA